MRHEKKEYPASRLPPELVGRLRSLSDRAEANGELTADQLAIIHDHQWFKLFVPRSLGGLELSLPEGVRQEEELAWVDGSLGWTATLCAGANLFMGYMDPSIVPAIFADPAVCLGGSGQATGRAIVEKGGYRVSGRWRYATGAPHLTHFTANCTIEQGGKALLDDDGSPLVRSFFFPKADVRMLKDWNAFGLRATASHSFEVDNRWVDKTHAFLIAPHAATRADPIYRYPFLPFAEATLAANMLGMARHFLTCAAAVGSPGMPAVLGPAEAAIAEARTLFYAEVDASWDELLRTGGLSPERPGVISERSRALVRISREQVVAVYPQVGLVAADASSAINRIWRDMFTASQHTLLR